MALAQEDIQFIKAHLGEWLAEQSLGKPPAVYEIELRERMVRVEEELKHQRELMREGFERMDERFIALRTDMDQRFQQVDQRFEQANKRHDELRQDMLARFAQVDKRFEQVDKRFDEMIKRHDTHFLWILGFIATGVGLVIIAMRYLPGPGP
ncbi:hypothetical protein [Halochromatium roseum]|uniref:hypothetical protein n=1 Tax=Halochromatium roseum TaxID=391920 RepID=UPI0019117904|nr:hypothetical protein [Halochromatium roseum]MBK5937864.1 hypothetical protein [Halochromatium roseum]